MKGDKRKQRKIDEMNKKIAMEQIEKVKSGKKVKGIHKVGAGPVQYDEKEAQLVIDSKQREFLHKQRDFRSRWVQKAQIEENLKEMKYILEKEKPSNSEDMSFVTFRGNDMSYSYLQATYDVNVDTYSNFIYELERINEELIKKYGLTNQQVIDMVNERKFIKEIPEKDED